MLTGPQRRPLRAFAALFIAAPAHAAGGMSIETALLGLIGLSVVGWLIVLAIYRSPARDELRAMDRWLRRSLPLALGLAALAWAAGSVWLGRTTIGHGVVLREVDPHRFWQLVKLDAGAGGVLVVLSLLRLR